MIRTMRALILAGAVAVAGGPVLAQGDKPDTKEKPIAVSPEVAAQELVDKAHTTVLRLEKKPRFVELLGKAKGVLIVPELLKAGFIVGGKGGPGVLLARDNDGNWSYPAFYRIAAGSVGLQFGVEVAEMGLVIMSDAALERVLEGNLEIGAGIDITVAAIGGSVEVGTEVDIYSFSISKGAFAGVSFEGATLSSNEERNAVYYGQSVTARQITKDRTVSNMAADRLLATLAKR